MPLVLAVDDEPINQRAVRRALFEDCAVLAAGSGAEALEILAREPVELVITDQRMPGMSGNEFLRHTVCAFPQLVRVVLTGYADVSMLIDAVNAGHVYHVLTKPWDARELRLVVRRGLERRAVEAERQRLLAALETACGRARREADQKSRLLLLTAHELGTPLHILLNALELLAAVELPAAAVEWRQTADRAGQWLARGVAQMHTGARVGQGALRVRREAVDLAVLAEQVAAALRAALRERSLTIATEGEAGEVRADGGWVRAALWSLLTNAVRWTPDGGTVRIEVRHDAASAVLAVRDTGVGIAAEHLDEIFEPFSAAGGDPLLHGSGLFAFGARGLGLGLALVRGVAEAHGGRVGVESRPGAGSCFSMHLPRA